jgi:hypothetical protein
MYSLIHGPAGGAARSMLGGLEAGALAPDLRQCDGDSSSGSALPTRRGGFRGCGREGSGRRLPKPDCGRRGWRTAAEERVSELRAWAAPLRTTAAAGGKPAMAEADGLVSRGMWCQIKVMTCLN